MTEQKNIHEAFLRQAKTHHQREALALQLQKTPGEINSLTAYHDFRRLKSVNKHLAKIYIIAGIRGISHLKKLSVHQVQQKIQQSRIGNSVQVQSDIISDTLREAKGLETLVIGLEKEKFFLQRKGYIVSKNPISVQEESPQKEKNSDVLLLCTMIIVLIIASFISLFFLALIPVILTLHFLLETRSYKIISNFIRNTSKSSGLEKSIAATILAMSSLIFAVGFFNGNIDKDIQKIYTPVAVSGDNYFSPEIFTYYKDREITREDLVKILTISTNADIVSIEEIECFKDSFKSKYPKEICYAKQKGFIQGDSLGNFNPNTVISHAAGLKFILNYYDYNVPKRSLYLTYEDLQKSQWQTTYAEYAKRIGLIDSSVKEFQPDNAITIEQVDRYISVISSFKK